MKTIQIAPSILAADFAQLGAQVEEALQAGVTYIHVDVMDGRFVPNLTIGPLIVQAIKPIVAQYNGVMDVHLMIVEPERYLADFAQAGADILTVHQEACPHLHRVVQIIHELGCRAGVALNPATPLTSLEEILPELDLALIMSVNPGFGGQKYIPHSTAKIGRLRHMITTTGSTAVLEVDGGVKPSNAAEIASAGADILVAGSAIFNKAHTIATNITTFHQNLP